MRKLFAVVLMVLALGALAGIASATPNGGIVPMSSSTGR